MKLYRKEIRPYSFSPGPQGFRDTWDELEDWQPEKNEEMLRKKYVVFDDPWASLKFECRFIEHENSK